MLVLKMLQTELMRVTFKKISLNSLFGQLMLLFFVLV